MQVEGVINIGVASGYICACLDSVANGDGSHDGTILEMILIKVETLELV